MVSAASFPPNRTFRGRAQKTSAADERPVGPQRMEPERPWAFGAPEGSEEVEADTLALPGGMYGQLVRYTLWLAALD